MVPYWLDTFDSCVFISVRNFNLLRKWKRGGPRMEKKSGVLSNIRSYLSHFRRSYQFYKKKITYYLFKGNEKHLLACE